MFITNEDFAIIASALSVADANAAEVQAAKEVLKELQVKKARDNKRIAEYIAEKRSKDKNYARSRR